ncbi:MAG: zinc ribbon domain-containing protein [Ilumatobacteraceae bacterium]
MPTYEFRCRTCDTAFEERRAMAQANAPATCPNGHDNAVRLLSVFASVGASTSPTSTTGAPVSPSRGCGAGCGCHHS